MPAPVPPALALPQPDETHVWQLSLPLARPYLAQWGAWLSADERDRAQRFLRPEDRDRFQLSRGGLRWLLAHYCTCSPTALTFTYGLYGRPELSNPSPLHFNLAHSGQWVVYGIACGPLIGVDVEHVTRRTYLDALIQRCLTPEEQRTLPTEPEARLQTFFRYWTVKEAHLKAIGLGLSYPLVQVQVGWQPLPHLVHPAAGPDIPPTPWTLKVWQPDTTAIAAVCVGQAHSHIAIRPFPLIPPPH